MLRTLLKSKIHRVTVTHGELHGEGSRAPGADLLDASGMGEHMCENEQGPVWNINNGERFSLATWAPFNAARVTALSPQSMWLTADSHLAGQRSAAAAAVQQPW